MQTSNQYGPQFDPTDGTIGELQLEKRYVICLADGSMSYPHQGRFTSATRAEAQERLNMIKAAHPAVGSVDHVEAWWCYPRHHDPVGPVEEPQPEVAAI